VAPTRDFNYVGDTVDAFLSVGTADGVDFGKPYNTGTGVEVSVGDVIGQICDLTGANKPVESDATRLRPESSEVQALVADSSRLRGATGWAPKIDLAEGLGRTIDWWRGRIASGAVRPDSAYMT
ncbi:MAG: GDP-mannose 4,6-dehydratase, partial [Pseudomonadota bacterium]